MNETYNDIGSRSFEVEESAMRDKYSNRERNDNNVQKR